jgi:hypothetical protein
LAAVKGGILPPGTNLAKTPAALRCQPKSAGLEARLDGRLEARLDGRLEACRHQTGRAWDLPCRQRGR